MGLKGVGKITEAVELNGGAVGPRPACVVQFRLQQQVAGVAPGDAPRGLAGASLHQRYGHHPQPLPQNQTEKPRGRRGRHSHYSTSLIQRKIFKSEGRTKVKLKGKEESNRVAFFFFLSFSFPFFLL